ncbi:hypothetical protein H7K24_13865 [Mycobacterium fragae]|uniref:Uncharacterized protein n=1 Tax=Mycobacterium fragae TaxID=1260918 RepID=A0A1X1UJK6_9MYCO|nr:hypothetical protein [Mycobacterium fragae]MCV7401239.1 hypothetical protein [Mycobacterium fragae]ORV56829.1 hypothetical protein AWC06_01065 [Mycobacterium fragae]
MFVIRLLDGEEVHASDGDKLSINHDTGVLSVSRVDGFEEVTTHYSPSAWGSVTHRVKEPVVRPSLVATKR